MLAQCSLQCELLHQDNLYIVVDGQLNDSDRERWLEAHLNCIFFFLLSKALCKRMQHWPTTPNIVLLNAVHVASVYTTCCMFLGIAAQSLKPVKRLSQLPPTFILFCDPRSLAKQCWVCLHSSFHHCWGHAGILHMVSKVLWVVSSCGALQIPTLLGVIASVRTPLPTRTQKLSIMLAHQCWELLRQFAHNLSGADF